MRYTRVDLQTVLDHAHVCECGALVLKLGDHDRFHESLARTAESARYADQLRPIGGGKVQHEVGAPGWTALDLD
jgi:hypothetical protein